jgi:hypothetical protein
MATTLPMAGPLAMFGSLAGLQEYRDCEPTAMARQGECRVLLMFA